jgi:DNA-binding Xre family transcriptional regulator
MEVNQMLVSYKKLWKLLIDKDMKKQDLRKAAHIAPASMAKLAKGESVTTDTLLKICKALNCGITDIMDTMPEPDDKA